MVGAGGAGEVLDANEECRALEEAVAAVVVGVVAASARLMRSRRVKSEASVARSCGQHGRAGQDI